MTAARLRRSVVYISEGKNDAGKWVTWRQWGAVPLRKARNAHAGLLRMWPVEVRHNFRLVRVIETVSETKP